MNPRLILLEDQRRRRPVGQNPPIVLMVLAVALELAKWCTPAVADDAPPTTRPVEFNRDVRPILSEKCFACHGPDEKARQGELRLDDRASALADRGGYAAIVPGNAEASAVLARVLSDDPDERMPPASTNKRLTEREVDVLRTWVDLGAEYQRHWAFEPLRWPAVPTMPAGHSFANPIDAFVARRLHEHGRRLAREAPPETLLRRVTLDLTGLPPTLAELDGYLADLGRPGADSDACYERVVDRLLQSPHFGEHLAVGWLDAARYADTHGYFGDKPRQMWLWRDWVINAFNANQPFDEFTIEQLAGDLLPEATIRQRIATGFNRNHMANNETGIIDEEFRVEYVVDRVNTTMATWLGLTAGCAQCHDHKFDPISQREFYQLFAFFNNVPETGLIHDDVPPPPLLYVPSAEQEERLARLKAESSAAAAAFEAFRQPLAAAVGQWEDSVPPIARRDELASRFLPGDPDDPAGPAGAEREGDPRHASGKVQSIGVLHYEAFEGSLAASAQSLGTTLVFEPGLFGQSARFDATQHIEARLSDFNPDGPWTIGFWFKPDGPLSCPLSRIEPTGERRGVEMLWGKGILKVHLVNRWGARAIEVATTEPMRAKTWHHVVVAYDGSRAASGVRLFVDGSIVDLDVRRDTLQGSISSAEPLRIGRRDSGLGCYGQIDELWIAAKDLDLQTVGDWYWSERIRGILALPAAERGEEHSRTVLDYFVDRFAAPEARAARERVRNATSAEAELAASIPTVLVMQEQDSPRTTYVLERGQYDHPREAVEPGVPAALAAWPDQAPRNRLGFARWLVSPENPLTPRVAANRLWRHCFGEGLVRTVDDFGTRGEPPSHPELLDWLAATFREDGWDVKRLLRQIVTSRTYRQDSALEAAGLEPFDGENLLLARGPSRRLPAEMLRDQALAVSGLLVPAVGGPSVKPYQPAGLWEDVSYNGEETYVADPGLGLWRRSVYTYIKRQAPPPALLIFDGPTREQCVLRRNTTSTPLQALLLLNDETFVEAARALASRILGTPGDDEMRLNILWRTILLREPEPAERNLLLDHLDRQRNRFAADPEAAGRLVSIGASRVGRNLEPCELAAWTVAAHTVLNLDEAVTRP
jgi:hypothetical protein